VLVLAACAALTKQPADFSHRAWGGVLVIGLASVICAAMASTVGIAAPLAAGLALAALYSLGLDPALPDSIVNSLPNGIALLAPTVPMIVALVFIVWWVIFALTHRRKLDEAPVVAVRSVGIGGSLVLAMGVIIYLGLVHIYDLEGGAIFWKFLLVSFLYLNLLWMGIEASARSMFRWPVAAVLFLGMLAGFVHNLHGGSAQ
jgi:hypothetical protein